MDVDEFMKPKMILENIERRNLPVPLLKDLYNYLYTLRDKRLGKSNMTVGEYWLIKTS